jgi:translation initiation factor 2-alpha kinase 4
MIEALELLSNPQSEGLFSQIIDAIFQRPTSDLVDFTYDTDTAVKANAIGVDKRTPTPSEGIMRAIRDIRTGTVDATSLSMSNVSLVAATASLNRSRNAMNNAKASGIKGVMKRSQLRTSGVLAMTAATSAAVEGNLDGVLGKDPRIVEMTCSRLSSIFQSHGAVNLRPPLLRPHHYKTSRTLLGGPAEVLNRRGVVLLLPEDLTASFARSVGRGGSGASNLKRYVIDRVYHRAMAGGHPRESLEASFDIIQDDPALKGFYLEAETLLVVSQVMAQPDIQSHSLPFEARPPMWYLRLTHTRLADAIMEICGVKDEHMKSLCLRLFTDLSAPPPTSLFDVLVQSKRKRSASRGDTSTTKQEKLEKFLSDANKYHGLSSASSVKLKKFFQHCLPLPANITHAITVLKNAVASLSKVTDDQQKDDTKLLRRFEDAGRIIKHLQCLVATMQSIGCSTLLDFASSTKSDTAINRPLFISLDLGLRQRRKHYHGQLFYQCIALPSNYFEQDLSTLDSVTNETLLSSSGKGLKVAEGGRYDDLVRKSIPPGNFGSALFNTYTTSPIPRCAGVRFAIGRLVELLYQENALSNAMSADTFDVTKGNTSEAVYGMEAVRNSMGHPLNAMPSPTQCIVASGRGIDTATAQDRFIVASRLWAEGVSCDYLSQSGVISSLLKQQRTDSDASVSF